MAEIAAKVLYTTALRFFLFLIDYLITQATHNPVEPAHVAPTTSEVDGKRQARHSAPLPQREGSKIDRSNNPALPPFGVNGAASPLTYSQAVQQAAVRAHSAHDGRQHTLEAERSPSAAIAYDQPIHIHKILAPHLPPRPPTVADTTLPQLSKSMMPPRRQGAQTQVALQAPPVRLRPIPQNAEWVTPSHGTTPWIVREMFKCAKAWPAHIRPQSKAVYIGRLPENTTDADIVEYLKSSGSEIRLRVKGVKMMKKGWARVDFVGWDGWKVMKLLSGKCIDSDPNQPIMAIPIFHPPSATPGSKESDS